MTLSIQIKFKFKVEMCFKVYYLNFETCKKELQDFRIFPKRKLWVFELSIDCKHNQSNGVVAPNEIEKPKAFKHFVFLEKKNP